jgi:hypothetical protein
VPKLRGQHLMAAKDPAARRTNALIAVHTSWAKTPIRSERTENARRNSPARVEYWEARLLAEGVVAEADIPKAAENARRAYMTQLSKRRKPKRAVVEDETETAA